MEKETRERLVLHTIRLRFKNVKYSEIQKKTGLPYHQILLACKYLEEEKLIKGYWITRKKTGEGNYKYFSAIPSMPS